MGFVVQPGQTVLFTGDSITDCGRSGEAAPLGSGYVSMAANLMLSKYPAHQLNVINTGIGGHTVVDLEGRWTDDVIAHQPHWLSIMIGINDLHRFLNGAGDEFGLEGYAKGYDRILARVKAETEAQLVLLEPFYMRTEPEDEHQAKVMELIPSYITIVHQLADKYAACLVKTHEVFQNFLAHYPPETIGAEPVHPNLTGHSAIALAWLEIMRW